MKFFAAFQLLLIALKFTGHVKWPWWLVLGPLELYLLLVLVYMALFVLAGYLEARAYKRMTPAERAHYDLAKSCREMETAIRNQK